MPLGAPADHTQERVREHILLVCTGRRAEDRAELDAARAAMLRDAAATFPVHWQGLSRQDRASVLLGAQAMQGVGPRMDALPVMRCLKWVASYWMH